MKTATAESEPGPQGQENNASSGNASRFMRYAILVVCSIVGALMMFYPPKRIDFLDSVADSYFESTTLTATTAYGSARLVNAGVSVVKESTLQLEPGGVGVALAVGQVADPLDDLTERMSSVLVTSIVSLMAQKLGYEIAQEFVFQLLGALLVLIAVLSISQKNTMFLSYRNLLIKISIFLLVIRFFLPCSALISYQVNERIFTPQIEEHQAAMEPTLRQLKELTAYETPKIEGLGDLFSGPVKMMSRKSEQLNHALMLLSVQGGQIFKHMIEIMSLYLGVFVIQVIFIPVFMFWVLNKLLFVLFSHTIPQPWVKPRNGGDFTGRGNRKEATKAGKKKTPPEGDSPLSLAPDNS